MPTKRLGTYVSPSGDVYRETEVSDSAQIFRQNITGLIPITATSTQAEDEARFARQDYRAEEEVDRVGPEVSMTTSHRKSDAGPNSAVSLVPHPSDSPNEHVNDALSAVAPVDENIHRASVSGRASPADSASDHGYIQVNSDDVPTTGSSSVPVTTGDQSDETPTSLPESIKSMFGWRKWFASTRNKSQAGLTANSSDRTKR